VSPAVLTVRGANHQVSGAYAVIALVVVGLLIVYVLYDMFRKR